MTLINPIKISQYFIDISNATQKPGHSFSERQAVKRALAQIYDFVENQGVIRQDERLLDIGMGGGQSCAIFKERFGVEYWGISTDPTEILDATIREINSYLADMHDLPFDNEYLDIIWASHVLEHSCAPLLAVLEWRRVLKENGRVLLWCPIGRDFQGKDDGTSVYGCRDHILTLTVWQYRWLFHLAGYSVNYEIDVPYQIENEHQQNIYNRKKERLKLLAKLGLTVLPQFDLPTAKFFVIKRS